MSTENTSSETNPPEMAELDEQEVLFNAYLDGDLSAQDEAAFDERLDEDPEFREAYGDFADVMGEVQNLPYQFAPDDFSKKLQRRIRVRSRGRFFGDNLLYSQRTPYEVVAVVMIVVMTSAYLFMGIPPDQNVESAEKKRLELPPEKSASEHPPKTAPSD